MKSLLKRVVFWLVLLMAKHVLVAQISFAPPVKYPVGAGKFPDWVMAKDINEDGKVDLIFRNSGPFELSILTNTGSGTFVAAPGPPVEGGVLWWGPADLNGSGKVDLVCESMHEAGAVSLMTNDGTGHFALSSKLQLSYPPDEVMVGDMNHDGKTDLIRAAFRTISVYTNDGTGNIPFDRPYITGSWQWTGPVVIMSKDINGDGQMDVLCLNGYADNITVLTNDGQGALLLASSPAVGASPYTFASADVNRDGKVDLITANSSDNTLTVLTNGGSGRFSAACTVGAGAYPYSVSVADLDGDGKLELFCANPPTGSITILTNEGQGVFAQALSVAVGGRNADWVTVADFDGDGKPDLAATDANGNQLWVLVNTTAFAPPASAPVLSIRSYDNKTVVEWPSSSAGWSLQQSSDLLSRDWTPASYGSEEIVDDGTNQSLTIPPLSTGKLFFRLLHP